MNGDCGLKPVWLKPEYPQTAFGARHPKADREQDPRFAIEEGWLQDVFAERCSLHRAHMGTIERGEGNGHHSVQTLKIIAYALGVRIRDLVSGIVWVGLAR